jgi:hypothetical protein
LRITGTAGKQKAIVICANGKQKTLWSKKTRDREEQHCGQ